MASGDTRVGQTFGHYKLTGLLGRGGMGEVYRAEDTKKGRTVALKILAEQFWQDEKFRTRFQRESRAAAVLQEPHVIPIHDWGEIDGHPYIDMRLVEGQTLQDLLANRPLAPARASFIIGGVAAALDAAHAAGLVHRDVKPQNIIVTPSDFPYLVDFGIAEAKGESGLTMTGMQIGTFAYMAPERFRDKDATPAVDVYALACVLYECLTGEAPFSSTSLEQIMTAHLMLPPPRPSEANRALATAFDDVIARGMAKEPDDRYGSCGALGRAAQRAVESDTVVRMPPGNTMQAPPSQNTVQAPPFHGGGYGGPADGYRGPTAVGYSGPPRDRGPRGIRRAACGIRRAADRATHRCRTSSAVQRRPGAGRETFVVDTGRHRRGRSPGVGRDRDRDRPAGERRLPAGGHHRTRHTQSAREPTGGQRQSRPAARVAPPHREPVVRRCATAATAGRERYQRESAELHERLLAPRPKRHRHTCPQWFG